MMRQNIKVIMDNKKNCGIRGKFENAVNDMAKDSGKIDEWIKFRENWRKEN